MSKGNAGIVSRKVWDLLPPRKMIPADSVGKHDRGAAAAELVIDLSTGVLNKSARDRCRISSYRRLPFVRPFSRGDKQASSGYAGELCEIAACNHSRATRIVNQSLTSTA